MKWQRWVIRGALLALVLGTGAAYLATRESSRPRAKPGAADAAQVPLVDERPLPTARALAALAITPEEQRLAQEAARIADHEVDLAFADALRQAAEQQPAQDPKSRDLYLKMQQAQTALTDVLSRVEQVKAKIATAKPGEKDALQDQKDLLDAEQALDEDEIEDAQQELIQTGADQESAVQRQRDQHEAGEHEFDQRQSQNPVAAAPAVDLSANNLAGQVCLDVAARQACAHRVGAQPGTRSWQQLSGATPGSSKPRSRRKTATRGNQAALGGPSKRSRGGGNFERRQSDRRQLPQTFFQRPETAFRFRQAHSRPAGVAADLRQLAGGDGQPAARGSAPHVAVSPLDPVGGRPGVFRQPRGGPGLHPCCRRQEEPSHPACSDSIRIPGGGGSADCIRDSWRACPDADHPRISGRGADRSAEGFHRPICWIVRADGTKRTPNRRLGRDQRRGRLSN